MGDRLEVSSPGGGVARHGLIVEVLGAPGHERYRVHWLDDRESIHYPSDGTRIRPRRPLEHLAGADGPDIAWDEPVRPDADHVRG